MWRNIFKKWLSIKKIFFLYIPSVRVFAAVYDEQRGGVEEEGALRPNPGKHLALELVDHVGEHLREKGRGREGAAVVCHKSGQQELSVQLRRDIKEPSSTYLVVHRSLIRAVREEHRQARLCLGASEERSPELRRNPRK